MKTPLNPMPDKEQLENASYYFGLLAEPIRLKILTALRNGERNVNDIAAEIGATQSNVSHKLQMLYQSRILLRRKEGTQVLYRIGDESAMTLCRAICRHKAVALRNACGGKHDTCRLPDRRCGISGGTCHWQPSLSLVTAD